VACQTRSGRLCVATGRCLVQVPEPFARTSSRVACHLPAQGRAGEPVELALVPEPSPGQNPDGSYHYTVDFIEPDGSLAGRRQGLARWGEPTRLQGVFAEAGEGRVEGRWLGMEGITLTWREGIRILPAAEVIPPPPPAPAASGSGS